MKISTIDIFKISFEADVVKPELLRDLIRLFGKSLPAYCRMTPPVVTKKDDGYQLIARHYSYDVFLHHLTEDDSDIPVLIVAEEESADIMKAESIEFKAFIAGQKALRIGLTPAGASLKKHREAGMTCPICRGILVGPKDRKPIKNGEHAGYFEVTCRKKSDSGKPCKFRAFLNEAEINLFWERKYPTADWLTILDEKCPKCVKRLFLRIRNEKQVALCEDNFLENGTCKFRRT
jgi:hypothetical protein